MMTCTDTSPLVPLLVPPSPSTICSICQETLSTRRARTFYNHLTCISCNKWLCSECQYQVDAAKGTAGMNQDKFTAGVKNDHDEHLKWVNDTRAKPEKLRREVEIYVRR
jgi:C4-type Zn-finger protein